MDPLSARWEVRSYVFLSVLDGLGVLAVNPILVVPKVCAERVLGDALLEPRLGDLDRPQQALGLVDRLLVFQRRLGVGNDASTGLDINLVP